MNKYEVDINSLLVKPIYLGLLINIFVPMLILLIAYYFDPQDLQKGQSMISGSLNFVFWVLVAVSAVDGGMAYYLKQKMFFSPMIMSEKTFTEDLTSGTFSSSIVCFALSGAISIYGLVYFFIGGTFQQLVFFVFISFMVFQLIRPRHGFIKKVIEKQEEHVAQGRFKEITK